MTKDKVRRQMKGEAEGDQGDEQGEPLNDAAPPRKQCNDDGSSSGHEGRKREYRIVQQDRRSLLQVHGKAEKSEQEQSGCA
jgi:hypothetical protein